MVERPMPDIAAALTQTCAKIDQLVAVLTDIARKLDSYLPTIHP